MQILSCKTAHPISSVNYGLLVEGSMLLCSQKLSFSLGLLFSGATTSNCPSPALPILCVTHSLSVQFIQSFTMFVTLNLELHLQNSSAHVVVSSSQLLTIGSQCRLSQLHSNSFHTRCPPYVLTFIYRKLKHLINTE